MEMEGKELEMLIAGRGQLVDLDGKPVMDWEPLGDAIFMKDCQGIFMDERTGQLIDLDGKPATFGPGEDLDSFHPDYAALLNERPDGADAYQIISRWTQTRDGKGYDIDKTGHGRLMSGRFLHMGHPIHETASDDPLMHAVQILYYKTKGK